jgi:hypothetical protein
MHSKQTLNLQDICNFGAPNIFYPERDRVAESDGLIGRYF